MRYPQLDERLTAAAELFSACELGADIGADHGRLSCHLLHTGKCRRMLVSDISDDSLSKARQLLSLHALDDRVTFRVADGLKALENDQVSCAAICGMGGALISRILTAGKDKLNGAAVVICSHTDIPLVRKTLCDIGYRIENEKVVRAKGRFYVVMRAEAGIESYTDKELYLGPCLLASKDERFLSYLKWREGVVSCQISHENELQWIREEIANVQSRIG